MQIDAFALICWVMGGGTLCAFVFCCLFIASMLRDIAITLEQNTKDL